MSKTTLKSPQELYLSYSYIEYFMQHCVCHVFYVALFMLGNVRCFAEVHLTFLKLQQ